MLKQQTGLSIGQISNWMANTRRRQKARPKRSALPSIRPSTEVINIPAGKTWESMSTYADSEFSRSHKTLAPKATGSFINFRVDQGRADQGPTHSDSAISSQMPLLQHKKCFG